MSSSTSRKSKSQDIKMKHEEKNSYSQLVMKNKTSGRKSLSKIHCIPKFSQVMPSKHMSQAQRALQLKIKTKNSISNGIKHENHDNQLSEITYNPQYGTSFREFHEPKLPELTIEFAKNSSKTRKQQLKKENNEQVPEITIIPKYPTSVSNLQSQETFSHGRIMNPSTELIRNTMNLLILSKEDFENISCTNPLFSTYIFLPKLNVFAHPLVVPNQMLQENSFQEHENMENDFSLT